MYEHLLDFPYVYENSIFFDIYGLVQWNRFLFVKIQWIFYIHEHLMDFKVYVLSFKDA